jgi:hypothetical protein
MKKKTTPYSFGEVFLNPYLGNRITEVLDGKGKRLGWLWETTEARIIVSIQLGFYLWYDEGGEEWTMESGALWLVRNR